MPRQSRCILSILPKSLFVIAVLAAAPLWSQEPTRARLDQQGEVVEGESEAQVAAEQGATTRVVEATPSTDAPLGNASPNTAEQKKKREALAKKVAGAYKPLFFDNDFSYVNDPLYDESRLGDAFKQMNLGDFGTLDIGGQYRARYHGERNMRGFGLTGRDDDFLLHLSLIHI